jgi:hypothetical protein
MGSGWTEMEVFLNGKTLPNRIACSFAVNRKKGLLTMIVWRDVGTYKKFD